MDHMSLYLAERTQSLCDIAEWKLEAHPGPEDSDRETQQPRRCETSSSPRFSLRMYLRRPPSLDSNSSTDSQSSNTGIDCAGIVLNCLFCQFYDMILQLPASCKKAANQCCPTYQQVTPAAQSPVSSEGGSHTDWDCGLLVSCKDANDCLELAMEVSELCYR
ncbi:myoD family inhibitor domain-containing protein 2 [Eucyclogobius newberryi]|uniref:myoD family inhibitor domain-containing protein 2 n=1 Tax=Eucyclogobius newberryi TaxID=166745 RepID=UPI003B5A4984